MQAIRHWRVTVVAGVVFAATACADTTATPGADGSTSDGIPAADSRLVDLPPPPPSVEVTGVVYAPEGTIPISGALVYLAPPSRPPEPIPQQVFCDECVKLTNDVPHAMTAPDGSFTIEATAGQWLVVTQKGAFRRVRTINVPQQGLAIDPALTTLPHATDAAQRDTIPKMLILPGGWDAVEDSLAKLGLGAVDEHGGLRRGTESFTIIECKMTSLFPPVEDCQPLDPRAALTDYSLLSQYQILFVPCGGSGGSDDEPSLDLLDGTFASAEAKQTLLKWIKAGGRLYVTDWRYDLLQQILPDYIKWEGQSSSFGTAELSSPYDAPATVQDQGLKDWLALQGITTFDLLESYTVVKSIHKLPTPGPDEQQKYDLMPTAWVLGDVPGYAGLRPMTISYHYGCGMVMFSTYHSEGSKGVGAELLPQEKALIYILLEVAVCITPPKVN